MSREAIAKALSAAFYAGAKYGVQYFIEGSLDVDCDAEGALSLIDELVAEKVEVAEGIAKQFEEMDASDHPDGLVPPELEELFESVAPPAP